MVVVTLSVKKIVTKISPFYRGIGYFGFGRKPYLSKIGSFGLFGLLERPLLRFIFMGER